MRVIIAGSRCPFEGSLGSPLRRSWYDRQWEALCASCSYFQRVNGPITHVISGGAAGSDALGERWSREVLGAEPTVVKADWGRLGRSAGMVRNRRMAEEFGAEGLIALWDCKSRGTANMIEIAEEKGLKILVKEISHYREAKPPSGNGGPQSR